MQLSQTYWDVGTVSVTEDETGVTFADTSLGSELEPIIMPGDLLVLEDQPLVPPQRIASIDYEARTAVLWRPWPGDTAAGADYEVRYVGIVERSTAQSRSVLSKLDIYDKNGPGFWHTRTAATTGDPGPGKFAFNTDGDPDTITGAVFSDIDGNELSIAGAFGMWVSGTILLARSMQSAGYVWLRTIGDPVAHDGWHSVELAIASADAHGGVLGITDQYGIWFSRVGEGLAANRFGLFAGRSTYNASATGFVYASADGDGTPGSKPMLYKKNSASSGDWSVGIVFAGDQGYAGWSPDLRPVMVSGRLVMRLVGYVGGGGSAPTDNVGKYAKGDGTWVAAAADAQDFTGSRGLSAYEVAVDQGFVGSAAAWLASLEGGDGATAYELAVAEGYAGTLEQWLASLVGAPGGDGTDPGLLYIWDEGTSNSNLGAGKIWANGPLDTADTLFVSKTARTGQPMAATLADLVVSTNPGRKANYVLSRSGGNAFARIGITGLVDHTDYVEYSIAAGSNPASDPDFSTNDLISLQPSQVGNAATPGDGDGNVVSDQEEDEVADGEVVAWSTTDARHIKGTGVQAADVLVSGGALSELTNKQEAYDNISLQGANIASNTTTDLSTATGRFVHITGNTGIAGFGVAPAGVEREVTFDGALTITHDATSNILPGGLNILTEPGDSAILKSEGSGNWRMLSFTRASKDAARADLVVPTYVASRAALKALVVAKDKVATLTEAGREGTFKWDSSDLSTKIAPASVTSTGVNSSTEVITKTAHGLRTGQAVIPTTTVNGLSASTLYYVIRVDADTFKLASSRANALSGSAFNLTGTTNFTVKLVVDDLEGVFVVPTGKARDGSQGAWVRMGIEARALGPRMFGTVAGTDDTEVIRWCLDVASRLALPVSFDGIDVFAVAADAQIEFYTDVDFAGAEWVILDGIVETPDFTYTTAFIVADPSTPLVTGTVATNGTDFVAGSVEPSASFWTDPGFLYIQGDGAGGQMVASRDRASTLSYRQSFAVVKDGRVVYPLEADMTGFDNVYYRARKNPERGWITIKGVAIEVSQINNEEVFRINRNMVLIDRPLIYSDDTLPESINAIFQPTDCAYVTIEGCVGEAQTSSSNGSYIFPVTTAAEIVARDCVAVNGWGWQGCSNTSGIYMENCRVNRFDCHNGGFNMFARNCHFTESGIQIGWGGGILQTDGCSTWNCDLVNSRVDYGGYWFGSFDISDTVLNRSDGTTVAAVNFQSNPVGCAALALPLPRSIRVAGVSRGRAGTQSSQYIVPVRIEIKSDAERMVAPDAIAISDVSGETATVAQAVYNIIDVNNMTGNRVLVAMSNIHPGRLLTGTDVTAGRSLLHSPAKSGGHTPAGITAVLSNVYLAVVDVSGIEGAPRVEMRGCASVGRARGASGGRFMISACSFLDPVLLSGESTSPIGGSRTGTFNITTVLASTFHGTWSLSNVAMMAGLLWPGTQDGNITLPGGVTQATAMSGWRSSF